MGWVGVDCGCTQPYSGTLCTRIQRPKAAKTLVWQTSTYWKELFPIHQRASTAYIASRLYLRLPAQCVQRWTANIFLSQQEDGTLVSSFQTEIFQKLLFCLKWSKCLCCDTNQGWFIPQEIVDRKLLSCLKCTHMPAKCVCAFFISAYTSTLLGLVVIVTHITHLAS